ncbi:MAG: Gfo/Idh/MocA family oxidoreductase [Bacteroidaceae bacterium]|nr:Gfo/Idh/MocA family oxidoreductase [Bacteroidaceae bacterium]
MKIGIVGAGHIAHKMARTLRQIHSVEVLAVASRNQEKAMKFASEENVARAYGSYEDIYNDPDVQLLYIATPHSHHFEPTRQALLHGKACLVEKAFTANAREAEELIRISHERKVLLVEAIWTRFMPISLLINQLLEDGAIGKPQLLNTGLCYKVDHKERVILPELCGGALLDLGVYVLHFARMYFGTDITRCVSNCLMGPTGVDLQETISLTFGDGKMANLQCGVISRGDNQAVISGTEGFLRIDNVNNPTRIEVYRGFELAETHHRSADVVTGYEFEVLECKRCLEQGLIESPLIPHAETLAIMQQMDELRRQWGVRYPMD